MRILTPTASTALAQPVVALAQLVRMDLAGGTLYLNTSGWNLVWDGHTWAGVAGVGRIQPVEDQAAELKGLSFELSGVPSSMVSLVLSEPVQGRPVDIWTAIFDSNTTIVDAQLEWSGRLDTLAIAETNGSAVVTVSAEHLGIDLLRPCNARFADQDQQRAHPGDTFFEYLIDQADQTLVWPAAAFFKK